MEEHAEHHEDHKGTCQTCGTSDVDVNEEGKCEHCAGPAESTSSEDQPA